MLHKIEKKSNIVLFFQNIAFSHNLVTGSSQINQFDKSDHFIWRSFKGVITLKEKHIAFKLWINQFY